MNTTVRQWKRNGNAAYGHLALCGTDKVKRIVVAVHPDGSMQDTRGKIWPRASWRAQVRSK